MTLNNIELYDLVVNSDSAELRNKLSAAPEDELFAFLQFQKPDDNNSTALHVAFEEADSDVIKTITQISGTVLPVNKLTQVLNIQNVGGINPIGAIFQLEEAEQVNAFATILGAFDQAESKKAVLLSYADNKETLLHAIVEQYNADLLDKVLEVAKTNVCLQDVLIAQDGQQNTPMHIAVSEKKKDFLEKTLTTASNKGILDVVLSAKEVNNDTIVHLGLESDNKDIAALIIEYVSKLSNPESFLSAKNTGDIKAIENLFDNANFIDIFKSVSSKTLILESITQNILSDENLKVSATAKSDIQLKVNALYEEVKSDNALKAKLLDAVNLDATDYTVTDFFADDIIKAKLEGVEKTQKTTVESLTDAAITKDALEAALKPIEDYKNETKFISSLPEKFGDSVTEAVKAKLGEVSTEAANNIKAADEAGLNTAYTGAQAKIAKYNAIYAKDGFDALKISTDQTLEGTVTSKVTTFVNAVCTRSYTKIQKAKDCISKIDSFAAEYPFLGNTLDTQRQAAQQYVDDQSALSKNEVKAGLNFLFYYFKDVAILKGIEHLKTLPLDDQKEAFAPTLRSTMTTVKSDLDAASNKVIGIGRVAGFDRVYSQSAIGKPARVEKFLERVQDPEFPPRIEKNDQKLIDIACKSLKIEGTCDESALLGVKDTVCTEAKTHGFDSSDGYKLVCDHSVAELQSLSFNSPAITDLTE